MEAGEQEAVTEEIDDAAVTVTVAEPDFVAS
jgi:hypothetical protein